MLSRGIRDQINSYLTGFRELIPAKLCSIFTEAELELMICGLPDVDVGDMRKHTEYKGWKESDPTIQWFWQIVNEMDQSDRAQLLQLYVLCLFVTWLRTNRLTLWCVCGCAV